MTTENRAPNRSRSACSQFLRSATSGSGNVANHRTAQTVHVPQPGSQQSMLLRSCDRLLLATAGHLGVAIDGDNAIEPSAIAHNVRSTLLEQQDIETGRPAADRTTQVVMARVKVVDKPHGKHKQLSRR